MNDDDQLDLRRFATVLWQRAWLIVVCGLVLGGAGYLVAGQQPDRYEASASVRVLDPNDDRIFGGADSRIDLERDVVAEIVVITSDGVGERADEVLGERADEIVGVSASARTSTEVVEVRVVATTAEAARDGANAIAEAYVAHRQDTISATFESRARELREKSAELASQVDELTEQIVGEPSNVAGLREQRNDLTDQISDLDRRAAQQEVEGDARTGAATIVETATLPEAPFDPRPVRTALLCGFVGVLFGIVLVLVLHRLEDTVTVEDAATVAGAPTVGMIERRGRPRAFRRGLPVLPPRLLDDGDLESFRTLRAGIRHLSGGSSRTILFTSPTGGEGTSTIVANLAVVLAESGLRVVAVSADLRRPTLASHFGLDDLGKGLRDVLTGTVSVSSVAQRVPTTNGILYLVPSGALPRNPTELLESRFLTATVSWLRDAGADFLLVDAPPVLPVADAAVLAQAVDEVLVVCVSGVTRRHDLHDAVDRLRQLDADVVGVVVNGVPNR